MTDDMVCASCDGPMLVVNIRHVPLNRTVGHPLCPVCLTRNVKTPDAAAAKPALALVRRTA